MIVFLYCFHAYMLFDELERSRILQSSSSLLAPVTTVTAVAGSSADMHLCLS